MRKSMYLMVVLCCLTLSVSSQSRTALYKMTKISLEKPVHSDVLEYSDERVSFSFTPEYEDDGYYFVGVEVTNKTENRVYIEWENARIDGSKVVFNDDRRMFMKEKKEDEAVVAGEKSETKYILPISNVGEHGIYSLFGDDSRGSSEIPIIIPIRYIDTIKDYKFTLLFSKYTESEIDSLYSLQQKYFKLSSRVKKKMTIQQVIEIMGDYEDASYISQLENEKKIINVSYPFITIWFDKDVKVSKIERKK